MTAILVSGLINLETTLRVDAFPVAYAPVRYPFFGVRSTVAGVGYNISRALRVLGDEVKFISLIGRDPVGDLVLAALAADDIGASDIVQSVEQTAQSVILYDGDGQRAIYTDLKEIQEQTYPVERFDAALAGCAVAALCNINFSRPFLARAHRQGKLIACDVHAIASLDDDYNADFMRAADILFMSHEHLPVTPKDWMRQLLNRYGNEIVAVGLGAQGVLLAVKRDNFLERIPAVRTRPVINTIGAGDALFSAFLHVYAATGDPYLAIRKAVVFASYKIGATGAAEGFLDEKGLNDFFAEVSDRAGFRNVSSDSPV